MDDIPKPSPLEEGDGGFAFWLYRYNFSPIRELESNPRMSEAEHTFPIRKDILDHFQILLCHFLLLLCSLILSFCTESSALAMRMPQNEGLSICIITNLQNLSSTTYRFNSLAPLAGISSSVCIQQTKTCPELEEKLPDLCIEDGVQEKSVDT